MGFLEFLGEVFDPGPVGELRVHSSGPSRSRKSVRQRAILALIFCLAWALLLGQWTDAWSRYLIATAWSCAYLVLAYFVRPRADYSNVGWLGGLVDNPFRYSDDANRFLVLLWLLLWPGKELATALVDGRRLLAELRRRDDHTGQG